MASEQQQPKPAGSAGDMIREAADDVKIPEGTGGQTRTAEGQSVQQEGTAADALPDPSKVEAAPNTPHTVSGEPTAAEKLAQGQ